jgi:hypothetical protein
MNLVHYAKNYPSQYDIQVKLFIDESMNFLNPLAYFNINTPLKNDTFPSNYPNYNQNILN